MNCCLKTSPFLVLRAHKHCVYFALAVVVAVVVAVAVCYRPTALTLETNLPPYRFIPSALNTL